MNPLYLVSTPDPDLSRLRLGLVGWVTSSARLGLAKLVTGLTRLGTKLVKARARSLTTSLYGL